MVLYLACGKPTNKYHNLKTKRMEQLTTEEKEFIFISLLVVEKKVIPFKYDLNTRQKHILKNLKYKLFKN